MDRTRRALIASILSLLFGLPAGCSVLPPAGPPAGGPAAPPARPGGISQPAAAAIQPVVHQTPASPKDSPQPSSAPARPAGPGSAAAPAGSKDGPAPSAGTPSQQGSPFAGASELSVEALVQEVLARNPTLPEMVAAWQAASARYPQVTSLDDPLLGTALAPAAIAHPDMRGYRVELFQRYPWPGKLQTRGEKALAEASAVGREVENARQQLTELARDAFYEYYLVYRAREVNAEILRLLRESRQTAETRYKTGQGSQQDLLLLDVEIGSRKDRDLSLDRLREVAAARINTLMHLPTDLPVPPPPEAVEVPDELPDPRELQARAQAERLDLLALRDRIAAAQASLKLAGLEYYPDFDVMAAYDAMWDQSEMRPQVAVRINLPVRMAKRSGAVAEAQARLAQLYAELVRRTDQAGFEVKQGYEQARESQRSVRLFEKEVLPAARLNVKSAQAAYQTGQIPLLVLLESQRSLSDVEDRYYEATAQFFRRRTALERALTGPPSAAPTPMPAERPQPGQPGSPVGMGRQ
jgi:cobalt-zinc-cadmium efflux system outer membrane protein